MVENSIVTCSTQMHATVVKTSPKHDFVETQSIAHLYDAILIEARTLFFGDKEPSLAFEG